MKQLNKKTKRRIFFWFMISCFISANLYAQNGARQITGKITGKNNEAIQSATITVKGTKNAVATDANGNFSIYAAPNETLVVSSVSYVTKEIPVSNKTSFNVTLNEDYSHLQDVVVIGYGTMKKTDLSSSQVTVTSQDIQKTVNTTFDQALQGRAAGVEVTQASGQPGAAPSVIIRGLGTLTQSSQPLYVIDGVQIRGSNVSDDPYNHPLSFSNILSSLNPDDIETINILQGPAATAIYGAAGGNGVVLITTKQGKSGQSKISFTSLLSLQAEPEHIDVMNLPQYADFRNEMAKAGGTASEPDFADPSVLGPGTDWQSALYRQTLLQKHEIALSGGSDKTTYYLSGEYFNQEGVAPGSGFQRYSTRVNLENQTRKWL
ncbi:MAG TPA: TonB-dependent receptor plug domain-containing protein, partial [Parafilimonas sp.]